MVWNSNKILGSYNVEIFFLLLTMLPNRGSQERILTSYSSSQNAGGTKYFAYHCCGGISTQYWADELFDCR